MFIDLWISENKSVSVRNSFTPSLETLQAFLTKIKQTVLDSQVDIARPCQLIIRSADSGSLQDQLENHLGNIRPGLYLVPMSADWDNKAIADAIQQRENSYSEKRPFAIIFFDKEASDRDLIKLWNETETTQEKPAAAKRSRANILALFFLDFPLSPAFWFTVTALLVGVPCFINSINPTFVDLSQVPVLSVVVLISGIAIFTTMALSVFFYLKYEVWAPSKWLQQLRNWVIDHKIAAIFCGLGFVATLAAIIAVSIVGIEAPFFEVAIKILTETLNSDASLETVETFAEIIFILAPLALGFLAKNVVLFSEKISQDEAQKEPMEVELDQGGNSFSIRYRDEDYWHHLLFKDQEFSDVLISDRVSKPAATVNREAPFSSVYITDVFYEGGSLGEHWRKQVQATQAYDGVEGAFRCVLKLGSTS